MPTNQVAVPDPNTGLMTSGLDADTLRKALAIAEAKGDSTAMELLKRLGQQSSKQYAGGRVVPVDVTGLNQGIANVAAAFVGGQEQKAEQDELNRTAQAKSDWLAEKPTPDQGTAAMEQWLTRGEQNNLRSTLQELIYGKRTAADAATQSQNAALEKTALGQDAAMDRTRYTTDAANLRAGMAQDTAMARTGSGRAGVPGGVAQTKATVENKAKVMEIDNAVALLQKNPDAVGLKNFLPDWFMQRWDPEGVPTRAALTNIGSLVMHDRSGANVTVGEQPRLLPFIPQVTDTADAAIKKMQGLKYQMEQLGLTWADVTSQPTAKAASAPALSSQKGSTGKRKAVSNDKLNQSIDNELYPAAVEKARAMKAEGTTDLRASITLASMGISDRDISRILMEVYGAGEEGSEQAATPLPGETPAATAAPAPATGKGTVDSPIQIRTQAEANALPSGTYYTRPDGKLGRTP